MNRIECSHCEGFGMVDIQWCQDGINRTINKECPICKGDGSITVKDDIVWNEKQKT